MLTFNHERRKSIMKLSKIITKLALSGALLGSAGGMVASTMSDVVKADLSVGADIPTATTKDYTKIQKLARKNKITKVKPKFFIDWVPGNSAGQIYTKTPYKLADNVLFDPGRQWDRVVGVGTIHGKAYVIGQNEGGPKMLTPVEYYNVPYGFKFKKGHKPVKGYYGSLAGAYNGYDEYLDEYGIGHTQENMVYSDRKDGYRYIKQSYDGQNEGKNKGFFIGLTAIPMNDGNSYYPLYGYSTDNSNLEVLYIRTEDIDQFKPAKVTYKYCGTLNKTKGTNYYHNFKPYKKKM